jgi:hypothetical protein
MCCDVINSKAHSFYIYISWKLRDMLSDEKVTISSWHFLMTSMMRTPSSTAAFFMIIIKSSTFSSCQARNCKQHHYFYLIQIFISNILGSINSTKDRFGSLELNQFHEITFLEIELGGIESIGIQFISNFLFDYKQNWFLGIQIQMLFGCMESIYHQESTLYSIYYLIHGHNNK